MFTVKPIKNEKLFITLLFLALPIPYIGGIYGTPLINLYLIPIFCLLIILLKNNDFRFYINLKGFLLYWALLLCCIIPSFINSDTMTILEIIRYAVFGVFILFVISPIMYLYTDLVAKTITILAVIFSVLGFITIISGTSHSFGLITLNKYYDMEFLGRWVPTTSSILWNTNYFGVYQLLSLPFAIYLLKTQEKHKVLNFLLCSCIFMSIFFSGSRSAITLASFLILAEIINNLNKQKKVIVIFLLFAFSLYFINEIKLLINEFLIGAKGTNGREVLVESAIAAVKDQIWGYGFGTTGEVLLNYGATSTTTQNTYLLYLLRGGVGGLVLYIIILLYSITKFIGNQFKRTNQVFRLYFSILLLAMIDGLVRSYSLGGFGFISLMYTSSVGIMWLDIKNE